MNIIKNSNILVAIQFIIIFILLLINNAVLTLCKYKFINRLRNFNNFNIKLNSNKNLYKKLMEIDDNNTNAVTVGKKVGLFTSKLSFELLSSYPMGSTLPDYSIVMQLKQIIDDYHQNKPLKNLY